MYAHFPPLLPQTISSCGRCPTRKGRQQLGDDLARVRSAGHIRWPSASARATPVYLSCRAVMVDRPHGRVRWGPPVWRCRLSRKNQMILV